MLRLVEPAPLYKAAIPRGDHCKRKGQSMFDLPSLTLFIAASWVLILTPGPDTLYVLTRGIAQGKQAGGIFLGLGLRLTFTERR